MTRNEKLVVAAIVLLGIGASGLTAVPPQEPAPEHHDCSGEMKHAMQSNPSLAAMRVKLCDEGGEAKVNAMIKDAEDERNKPAF